MTEPKPRVASFREMIDASWGPITIDLEQCAVQIVEASLSGTRCPMVTPEMVLYLIGRVRAAEKSKPNE